jgi:hypothetical protein
MQFAKNFYEAVVYDINGPVIPVYITENNFEAITIVPLIEDLLVPVIIFDAPCNYFI